MDRVISDKYVLLNFKKLSCEKCKDKLLLREGIFNAKLSNKAAHAHLEWIDKTYKK